MELAELYRAHPIGFILGVWLVSQIVLYAARVPVHRALRALGTGLGGGFRLVARLCAGVAAKMRKRNEEVLLEAGRADMERKIERELTRVSDSFVRELRLYPELHQKMDEAVTELSADLSASASAPPKPPAWPDTAQAVASLPDVGDPQSRKVLGEIRNMAIGAEKRTMKEYRDATAKRHRILAGFAQPLKVIKSSLLATEKAVTETLASAGRIDGYMDTYEQVRAGNPASARSLASEHLSMFLIALVVTLVAVGGAFVNFHLIALPMSELVPAGSRVAGTPVSTVAALVIVLMEAAAGIFVMEALGITELMPRIARLSAGRRRIVLGVALGGLFLLAAIESSLAILREQIVEAELTLKASLAGAGDAAVAEPVISSIPVVGQAVLGFILPWLLAMVALPLEMLIHSGRHVGARALAGATEGLGSVARVISWGLRQSFNVLVALFDVYIILPLQAERLLRRRGDAPARRERPVAGNPADRTGEHGAVS